MTPPVRDGGDGAWSRPAKVLAVAVILAAVVFSVAYKQGLSLAASPPPGLKLIDLHTLGELQARFNEDAGMPRLVLVMSPT